MKNEVDMKNTNMVEKEVEYVHERLAKAVEKADMAELKRKVVVRYHFMCQDLVNEATDPCCDLEAKRASAVLLMLLHEEFEWQVLDGERLEEAIKMRRPAI